ncbi:MAG: hypothetical protein ACREJ2_09175 [Planctomycetota bacterium]
MRSSALKVGVSAVVLGLVLAFAAPQTASACPFCADQVAGQSGSGGDPSAAYNYSIFAMVGIMAAVAIGLGRLMYLVVKQADADAALLIPGNGTPDATAPTAGVDPAHASTPAAASDGHAAGGASVSV